jgi:uncharacterized protein YjbI with pentapeptide repeats
MDQNQNREENIQRLLGLLEQRRDSNDPLSIPINFVGANLEGFDSGDFEYAYLEGANFERANLKNADLSAFTLTNANLKSAILTNANLTNTGLENANLEGAYLEDADLRRANLEGANLIRANLEVANLGFLVYLDGANLTNANLQRANLEGCHLIRTNFTEANLTDATLRESNLRNAILTGAILTRANIQDANLEGANINDAADLTDVDLESAFFNTRDYNEAFDYEENDEDTGVYDPPQGLAFEVHNKFTRIEQLKNQYLEIINQPNKQYEDIYTYIKDNFTSNIIRLFPDDSEKLNLFNTAFNQINNNDYFRIPERYIDLIGKSIDFAFSQDDEFKKQYIITFLDESCRAYSGPRDNLSCPKGIVERFILSVGSAAQILCTAECNNETYQKLDELFYPKFDIDTVSSEWWNNLSESKEVTDMSKEERKEHFKKYLRDKAKELNNYNDDIEQKITNYANEIDYSFENLTLGGRKTRKTRKIKKTMKNKKTVKSKKNKKSRKSIRSTNSIKNRQTIKYKSVKKSGKTRKSKKSKKY